MLMIDIFVLMTIFFLIFCCHVIKRMEQEDELHRCIILFDWTILLSSLNNCAQVTTCLVFVITFLGDIWKWMWFWLFNIKQFSIVDNLILKALATFITLGGDSILRSWPVYIYLYSIQNYLLVQTLQCAWYATGVSQEKTKLSFCTLGWAPSRTDSASCSHSCCPSERRRFREQRWDIWCSRIRTLLLAMLLILVMYFIWYLYFMLYLLFVIGSDGWEGEGIERKAWLGQGEERQNPRWDGSRGRWLQKTFLMKF